MVVGYMTLWQQVLWMVQMMTFEGSRSLPVSFFSGPFWHFIQLGVLTTSKDYHVFTTNIPVNREAGQLLF